MAVEGQLPAKIGRYEIVLQIARGGMATVYLARAEGHGGFDRYVALKLTAEHLRDDPEFAQHLVEEAKLVAHLRHTNVVPVLDVGEDELGAVFLVMEYVPGDSLAGLTKMARKSGSLLPPRIGLRVLVDVLAGLQAAHEHADEDGNPHRLVHRDFSPQNILVGTDGIARLTDFGISKAASRASVTIAGTMKGKVSYASPEQARGHDIDRRCDVWAAGVVAWEIIAGRKLYLSSDKTLAEIVSSVPPRLRDVMPDIPAELDEVVAQALQPALEARTPTAQAFARALSTAARNAGLLADVEAVADYVQRAVGPALVKRKETIAEARRLRGFKSNPELGVAAANMRLPSLPDIPLVTLRIDNAATVPANVAESLMSENRTLRADEMSITDGRSSFTPGGTSSGVPPPTFMRSSLASIVELKATVVDRVAHFIAKRPALVIGGASAIALLLLLGAVVVVASGPSEPKPDGKTAAPSGSANQSGSAIQGASSHEARVAVAVPPPPPVTPRPPLGEAEALPTQLEMAANAPIVRVRVGRRLVEMEVPAPNVAVDLAPEEAGASLPLSVTSSDGRVASAIWKPGDAAIAITFGEPHSGPTKPAGKPRTPKHR